MLFKQVPNVLPNNKGPLTLDVLWENAEPAVVMNDKLTIPLAKDGRNYDALICQWRTEVTATYGSKNETTFLWQPDDILQSYRYAQMTYGGNYGGSQRNEARYIEYLSNRNYLLLGPALTKGTMILQHVFGLRLNSNFDTGITDKNVTWIISPYRAINNSVEELCPSFYATTQQNGAEPLFYGYTTDGIQDYWEVKTTVSSTSWCYLISNDPIDVTNYSTIVVKCSTKGYGSANNVGLLTSKIAKASGDAHGNFSTYIQITTSTNVEAEAIVAIDVSNLTGNYYLGIQTAGSGNSNYSGISRLYWAFIQ